MKKVLLLVLAALLGAAGYFGYPYLKKPAAPRYRTVKVERGDIVVAVTATGTLNAVTMVSVGSQVSGTIRTLHVDFNSRVRKGQPIAQLDPSLFEAAVIQATGNVINARANLERAKVTVLDAARTLRRNKELLTDGFVAQADVDAAQTAYEQAVAQEKASEGQLRQAQGTLRVSETNLGYTTIYSPVDGIVISRNVDVGQTVAASFQTPTLFTIAQDLTKMQIDTSVDEADIAKVKTGQAANFTVDAYPEQSFSGVVHQVRNAPIVSQNVVTYDVIVWVQNRDLRLKPGMTANVTIPTQRFDGVLKIPGAALRYRPSSEAQPDRRSEGRQARQGSRVYRLGADGKATAVRVKLGHSDGNFYEVVEGGLKEGDPLVVEEIGKKAGNSGGGPPGMGMFR